MAQSTEHTCRDLSIAAERAKGKDMATIGKQFGITQQRVSQILSDKQIRKIMDRVQRTYFAHAPAICKQLLKLCYDKDDKAIRLKAIAEYNKITGIVPSHASSQFVLNVFGAAQQPVPPVIEQWLADREGKDEAIDVEYQEIG